MEIHDKDRIESRQRLIDILSENNNFFIFGAGIVGKRLYRVIENMGMTDVITGFVVSKKDDNESLFEKQVFAINELNSNTAVVLVAVSDKYQNEILCELRKRDFKNVINAYEYSFLGEEHFSKNIPQDVPEEMMVDVNELMIMQFFGDEFLRYDVLIELKQRGKGNACDSEGIIIDVDKDFVICNEAKIVSEILLNGVSDVRTRQHFDIQAKKYGYEWVKNNTTQRENHLLNTFLGELKQGWEQKFVAIIWPPAQELFDDLTAEIEKKANLKHFFDIEMDEASFSSFVYEMYKMDDVEEWKINIKLERMKQSEVYVIRVVEYTLNNPGFRMKRYGHTISETGMIMKESIRKHYREKVRDYVEDIILHTTDNYCHAKKTQQLIKKVMG